MAAGLIGLIITLWYWNSRRRTVVTRQTQQPVAGGGYPQGRVSEYRETREDVPPPPPPATELLGSPIHALTRGAGVRPPPSRAPAPRVSCGPAASSGGPRRIVTRESLRPSAGR